MQGDDGANRRADHAAYEPPPEPASVGSHNSEFQRGDTATFDDREGRNVTGVVVRINQRTATLATSDGQTWRVPFQALRHVLDV